MNDKYMEEAKALGAIYVFNGSEAFASSLRARDERVRAEAKAEAFEESAGIHSTHKGNGIRIEEMLKRAAKLRAGLGELE